MMTSMLFFHAGNETLCSSRIRSRQLARTLPALGVNVYKKNWWAAHTVFFQKKVTPGIVVCASLCKVLGKRVIYDIDDAPQELSFWHPAAQSLLTSMFVLADVVTTDTGGRKRFLEDAYGLTNVHVIPDGIDYFSSGPLPPRAAAADKLRILWFGGYPTLKLFERYAEALCSIEGVQLVVVTAAQLIDSLREKYPAAELLPWSLTGFTEYLRSCQLSVLMHDGSDADLLKSNNKMIASITWGVPAIVSKTPEYEYTAREVGVDDAVFESENHLVEIIKHYSNPEARAAYLVKSQQKIWDRYNPVAQSSRLIHILQTTPRNKIEFTYLCKAIASSLGIFILIKVKTTAKILLPRKMLRETSLFYKLYKKIESFFRPNRPFKDIPRDYYQNWISPEGKAYRERTFKRQSKSGEKPLVSNPTIDEIKKVFRKNGAKTILEIGCGWGRIMEELTGEFDISGCDVAREYLERCPPGLKVFYYDITTENTDFISKNTRKWDILFTRGVILYFMGHPAQIECAMKNMLALASKKIIIWEWPEVCNEMKRYIKSNRFEYHPIEHRDE